MIKITPNQNYEAGDAGALPMPALMRIHIVADEFTPQAFNEKIDHVASKVFSDVKLFVGLAFFFVVGITFLWSGWNVKNILKIDIFPGGHHDSIDEINASLGM